MRGVEGDNDGEDWYWRGGECGLDVCDVQWGALDKVHAYTGLEF